MQFPTARRGGTIRAGIPAMVKAIRDDGIMPRHVGGNGNFEATRRTQQGRGEEVTMGKRGEKHLVLIVSGARVPLIPDRPLPPETISALKALPTPIRAAPEDTSKP